MAEIKVLNLENYPSNSVSAKAEKKEEPAVEKKEAVVTQPAKKAKKKFGKKIIDAFFPERTTDLKEYLVCDVVIPAVKAATWDLFTKGLNILLYDKTDGVRPGGGSSNFEQSNYLRYWTGTGSKAKAAQVARAVNKPYGCEDALLVSKNDCLKVLACLQQTIDEFGMVSVAEYNERVGFPTTTVDRNYGWFDIQRADWTETRDGFVLHMPKIQALN